MVVSDPGATKVLSLLTEELRSHQGTFAALLVSDDDVMSPLSPVSTALVMVKVQNQREAAL